MAANEKIDINPIIYYKSIITSYKNSWNKKCKANFKKKYKSYQTIYKIWFPKRKVIIV